MGRATPAALEREAVGQSAAFKEGVERVFYKLWQVGAGGSFGSATVVVACCRSSRRVESVVPSDIGGVMAVKTANRGQGVASACVDTL